MDKAVEITHMLVEGVGIRSIERLTGTHRDTVLAVLEMVGQRCATLLDAKVRNVKFESVQVDEMFCFVGCKERNNIDRDPARGNQYAFIGVDEQTKFIVNTVIGKRDEETTEKYIADLKSRVQTPFQLTTDGWAHYLKAVYSNFYNEANFAQLVKQYASPMENHPGQHRRYSAAPVKSVKRKIHIGTPDQSKISTACIERTNLSVRLFNRRFTRLTLGYSKKLDNLKHQMALFQAHFNFCRIHSTTGKTPAMAAGITDHQWTVEELILWSATLN